MPKKILFVTGKLAERQLRRILKAMKPEFSYKISQIGVTVAALMSENILMRRVKTDNDIEKIIVPGRFRGNLEVLSKYFKIPVERGPDDLKSLPDYFGLSGFEEKLDDYNCLIFAEIVDATKLNVEEIINIAQKYRKSGANVIDIGCMPDTDFCHLEETVFKLKKNGFTVSVDSANSEELFRAGKSGADYLLSISEKNLDVMKQINSTPILIPSSPGDLKSLERIIEKFLKEKKDFFADPILDPIHYGFTNSLVRYQKIREKYPNIKMLMGTGNLTELTDADTVGVNAILMGIVSELNVGAVLVVQVSDHCKNSIKETDMARKIMYYAKINQRLPIGIDKSLFCLSERKPLRFEKKEIENIKSLVKDKNYRIMLGEDGINLFNSESHKIGIDPYEFFQNINVSNDTSHAFYLGIELARAQIAYTLGKNYNQDNELDWGIAWAKEKQNMEKRPKLKITQKKK